ncbi:galectin-3-binding protein A-like isoform X2 [Scomber scombrus]|uniref:Galectin-3-binding protein A-like isoform X2 n=1 Tax=Scomber scombrus TaxID=13677 RepID=A0AAV1NVM8_SCOSC|nr:galectin-3-binding protein A-like [Scomber scombrus]
MLIKRNLLTLWVLLLLFVSGSATKWNLFKRTPDAQEGDVRLTGSQSTSEGRVEVYHDGKWGTVCDDGWDMAEAQVACRQLHFPGAKSVVEGKEYGQASGPIWLDDITCKGTENRLITCGFKSWGVTDCTHKEDVGVICDSDTNVTMSNSTHSLDHSASLSDDLGQIFHSGDGCDFQITVQSATGNKWEDGTPEMLETKICAHRMIVSQFPFFSTLMGMTSITVNVSQSCQPHFTSFIRYLYTRKIDVTFSSAQCIHWMASTFGVKQLMEDTGRVFTKILPEDTSFHTQVSLHKYAVETEDLVLQENCIQYLAWNYENLTRSSAWPHLSVEVIGALLARSDLVVPDEYFVLQTVESWILEKGNSSSLETQAELLGLIRFPMIPAEKLYDLESNSSLYSTHENMYRENMLKALQFNVLLFSNLQTNPKFNKEDDDYHPRIYTSNPWSTVMDPFKKTVTKPVRAQYPSYNRRMQYDNGYNYRYHQPTVSPYIQTTTTSFSTPVHNSMIFQSNKAQWEANVFKNQHECSNHGLRCESVPVARLVPRSHLSQSNVLFRNRLLLMCQGKYICQVQDFKDNLAYIALNGTQVLAYPCTDDQYIYRFVVRPEYV